MRLGPPGVLVMLPPCSSLTTPSPAGEVPERSLLLAIGRYGTRFGHVGALRPVHRYTQQERTAGQEERGPVDPEAVAGVTAVDDEQDREDHGHDGDRHIAYESGCLHGALTRRAPLDLSQGREPIRDCRGYPGHQDERRKDSLTVRADVVDDHRDRGEESRGDDAEGGHPGLRNCL